jgi:poly-gamma-glutamate synthesis protein (capsule biosynthesis protein)
MNPVTKIAVSFAAAASLWGLAGSPSLAIDAAPVLAPTASRADVQFFGDTYLPPHVLLQTQTTAEDPRLFADVAELLKSAQYNVVNFEGVATTVHMPHEFKKYLLRMPVEAGAILSAANIDVATLANNHAYDFGYLGLFDTLTSLRAAGIKPVGAGRNIDEAAKPVILPSTHGSICIFAFTRALPESFWAGPNSPGTAYLSVEKMSARVRECAGAGLYTVVVFHWGEELSKTAQPYQSYLARKMIDAGAHAVIGHHPHVLQPVEIYAGRPIIHSLGNFAFGTAPLRNKQEGMAVALQFAPGEIKATLTPLNVNNSRVSYKPRPLVKGEHDPLAALLPTAHGCDWDKEKRHWSCTFKKPES